MRRRCERAAVLAVAGALLALAAATPGAAQDRSTLARLLSAFSSMDGLTARFTETKRIALLAAPLESEGVVHFAPPDRLLRRVTSPSPSAILLSGRHLTMVSNGDREELDLAEQPVVEGFVDTFRHVLAGDREALERTYRIHLEGDFDDWRLTLRPRDEILRRFLRVMELRGSGGTIASMRMVEQNGDETLTEFHDVRTDRSWSAEEAERVFSLP